MTLEESIKINTHYTRSINLERDADSKSIVDAYIPTSRTISTLSRIADTLHEENTPRSWALVGPYGSGKSSFALFLSHLLGNPADSTNRAASKVLRTADTGLVSKFSSHVRSSSGYCKVLLTGSPEPLAGRFIQALAHASELFWSSKPGRAHSVVSKLQKLSRKKSPSISEILEGVSSLQNAIAGANGKGVLIVFDEFGKFLEYEARHHGANDIFLLQALAEQAGSGHKANIYLYVLLHQAFEQYAKGLGETAKNEWLKVQGRFENVPFLESVEQVLRIVAAAIDQDLSDKLRGAIEKNTNQVIRVLEEQDALPGLLDATSATKLFTQCYPLHPVSAVLLPLLCQKIAQNERTLFSYLGSHEQYGFKDSLSKIGQVGGWIYPWQIYEYFILNQPSAVSDHFTHRRWAEVVTAVERLGDVSDDEICLLKTVGLLNIIGAQGGFKASKDLVKLCIPSATNIDSISKKLLDKSVVQFRKFSGEYRVWQGSDFDLDTAIEEEVRQLGKYSLSDELNNRKSLLPIVARKYTIQTGTLRYFQPLFIDQLSFKSAAKQELLPRIIFYLSEGVAGERVFKKEVLDHFSNIDILVLCPNGQQLREAVTELLALERVRVNRQELNADPVAQREYFDRLAVAEEKQEELLTGLIEIPENSRWFWQKRVLPIKLKCSLQHQLSVVLENVYSATPVFKNELINRELPSSQAAAARNKLLVAMLNQESEEDLSIDKYPAERGIYRAILWATKLHRLTDEGWKFCAPASRGIDKYNLRPVWKRLEKFFEESEEKPISFSRISEVLMAPPYGVKAGILPILYMVSYLANQHELAMYEKGLFRPYLSAEQVELFVRYPERYAIQRFRIEGMRASLLDEYAKLIDLGQKKGNTIVSLSKPLNKFINGLPEYTRRTQRLSNEALKIRASFAISKTPSELLFSQLPKAVGYQDLSSLKAKNEVLEGFAEALVGGMRELKGAHGQLISRMQKRFIQALNLKKGLPLSELRNRFRAQCEPLSKYTIDVDGLKEFIRRASSMEADDAQWIENLLAFLAEKPTIRWKDTDEDAAEYKLVGFSRRITDLKKLYLYYEEDSCKHDKDFEVYLLKSVRQGSGEKEQLVSIDSNRAKAIKETRKEISSLLAELVDPELQLAALAEVADDFLVKYRQKEKQKIARKKQKAKADG